MTPSKTDYLDALRAAIHWGLDDRRVAWQRTLAHEGVGGGEYSLAALGESKTGIRGQIEDTLANWFDPVYAHQPDSPFDLRASPEDIWQSMVFLNSGIFTKTNGDLLAGLFTTVPSLVAGHPPMYLSANLDGWGIEPPTAR